LRHLISLSNIDLDDLFAMIERALGLSRSDTFPPSLAGTVVGTYFRQTSTRTRTAFSAGALRLGAGLVGFGPHDLQENTGETFQDTSRVLAAMLDCLVIRTGAHSRELHGICGQRQMSVVNAMTADEHPTQAITDLAAVLEHRGGLDGLNMLYIGEGNNTATALVLALAKVPHARLHLRTPAGYGVPIDTLRAAGVTADANGSFVVEEHDPTALPAEKVDVVYTTRWQTTGTSKRHRDWRSRFRDFTVTEEVMARYPCAVFMHDLPAHRGEEVAPSVLGGERSIAFRQAEFKLYGAMAVLEWCLCRGRFA
jgi:ornithine carbamoyltransferase